MKSALTCVACLALLVLVGCSAADPKTSAKEKLVGSWKAAIPVEEGMELTDDEPMTMEFTFQDDGTMNMEMPFAEEGISGTWEVTAAEEEKVTIKTVMKMPSYEYSAEQTGEGPDAEMKETTRVTYSEDAADLSIVFETDDRMTMTPTDDPSSPMTLDRQ